MHAVGTLEPHITREEKRKIDKSNLTFKNNLWRYHLLRNHHSPPDASFRATMKPRRGPGGVSLADEWVSLQTPRSGSEIRVKRGPSSQWGNWRPLGFRLPSPLPVERSEPLTRPGSLPSSPPSPLPPPPHTQAPRRSASLGPPGAARRPSARLPLPRGRQ